LNIARIEAGVVQVKKQARSLNEVLEKVLQVMKPAAESKQIALSADLSPLYLGVYLDHDLALQAAINLISNAVKYTPVGGQVIVRSRMADDEARFDVEDNGVGLSAEDCVRVFEKFYRVHKDKELAAGTGLGLPLVKHIIEDVHGGRLAVQSTPGKGSVFTVFLPTAATLT
jgi:two-component system phosphate regulon sensor histidine kinase PhoR